MWDLDEKLFTVICSNPNYYYYISNEDIVLEDSEVNASELIRHLEESFPRCYMHSDMLSMFKHVPKVCYPPA